MQDYRSEPDDAFAIVAEALNPQHPEESMELLLYSAGSVGSA